MTNLLVRRYDPIWLHDLQKQEREEVVEWIGQHDIDPQLCAEFDVTFGTTNRVRCKIYRTYNGQPIWNPDLNAPEFDRDQVFSSSWLPPAIARDHPALRSSK